MCYTPIFRTSWKMIESKRVSSIVSLVLFSLRVVCLLTPWFSRVLPRDAFAPLDTFVIWRSQAVAETGCSTFGWLKIAASQPAGLPSIGNLTIQPTASCYPRAFNISIFSRVLVDRDSSHRSPRPRIYADLFILQQGSLMSRHLVIRETLDIDHRVRHCLSESPSFFFYFFFSLLEIRSGQIWYCHSIVRGRSRNRMIRTILLKLLDDYFNDWITPLTGPPLSPMFLCHERSIWVTFAKRSIRWWNDQPQLDDYPSHPNNALSRKYKSHVNRGIFGELSRGLVLNRLEPTATKILEI